MAGPSWRLSHEGIEARGAEDNVPPGRARVPKGQAESEHTEGAQRGREKKGMNWGKTKGR